MALVNELYITASTDTMTRPVKQPLVLFDLVPLTCRQQMHLQRQLQLEFCIFTIAICHPSISRGIRDSLRKSWAECGHILWNEHRHLHCQQLQHTFHGLREQLSRRKRDCFYTLRDSLGFIFANEGKIPTSFMRRNGLIVYVTVVSERTFG